MPDSVGLHQAQVATFRYDFADHGGAVGAITLDGSNVAGDGVNIPDDALILRAWVECVTAATSGGAATIALGITGNTDALIAATAYTDNKFDTPETVGALTAELPLKVNAAAGVDVIATVATAALTAGAFDVHVEYLPGQS